MHLRHMVLLAHDYYHFLIWLLHNGVITVIIIPVRKSRCLLRKKPGAYVSLENKHFWIKWWEGSESHRLNKENLKHSGVSCHFYIVGIA